jgi:phosphatidylserine decarboxylase
MSIGHSPDIPQFQPDMRQEEQELSLEEKQEANRRIGGNLAPPRG